MSKTGCMAYILVLLLVVAILAAVCFAKTQRSIMGGGAPFKPPPPSPHIVVDTLNLAHWLRRDEQPLTVSKIMEVIDKTAPILKKKHAGRVMYVLKDRESRLNTDAAHEAYMDCAERNRVYIIIAEKYADPPSGNPRSAAHSASGRDDFLIAVLASRWRCAALTEDRLRDFKEFRLTLQPFHAIELAYWRARASREYFRPESPAYAKLRKPRTMRFTEYFREPRC